MVTVVYTTILLLICKTRAVVRRSAKMTSKMRAIHTQLNVVFLVQVTFLSLVLICEGRLGSASVVSNGAASHHTDGVLSPRLWWGAAALGHDSATADTDRGRTRHDAHHQTLPNGRIANVHTAVRCEEAAGKRER